MRIDVSQLREGERLDLEHEYDPKELNLEVHGLRYLALLKLKGVLERVEHSVFFRGFLDTQWELLCTRCLKAIGQAVHEPFDLYYPYRPDEVLETTDDLREVMILSYPVKFLCDESCRGLCPQCGADLNAGPCGCSPVAPPDGARPFDPLGEWFRRKKHGQS